MCFYPKLTSNCTTDKEDMMKIFNIAICAILLISLTGCGVNLNTNQYEVSDAGDVFETYEGTIISRRKVNISGTSGAGTGVGGVAGGLIGSQLGGGRGSIVTTLGGAALGAVAGSAIEKNATKQQGWEYSIRIIDESGQSTTTHSIKSRSARSSTGSMNKRIQTVVQGLDNDIKVGTKVLLHIPANGGRARVVPITG